jgi:hypothetical protein
MKTTDGVTSPNSPEELEATGRWRPHLDRNGTAAHPWLVGGDGRVHTIESAIEVERDRALVAALAEARARLATVTAEAERLVSEWMQERAIATEHWQEAKRLRDEVERLRAAVPTRERVIEVIRVLLYPEVDAPIRVERQRREITAALDGRLQVDGRLPDGVTIRKMRTAERLLGLDVCEPSDPDLLRPGDEERMATYLASLPLVKEDPDAFDPSPIADPASDTPTADGTGAP